MGILHRMFPSSMQFWRFRYSGQRQNAFGVVAIAASRSLSGRVRIAVGDSNFAKLIHFFEECPIFLHVL